MSTRTNVVLICVDQWRGDCLSIDGHPVVHTPWLDQMALDGARCARAYAACPTCIAARASLHTGLTPRSHGRVGYRDGVPWNYDVTVAGEFTRGGYQTQAVGKLHAYPERSQIGFQNVILHDGFLHFARRNNADLSRIDDYIPWLRRETHRPDADYFEHGVNCNSHVARPWDREEYLHPTNWVVSQSIDFLRRRDPRKPFFLHMSFHRPHPPYDPPAWAFEQYLYARMPEPPIGEWSKNFCEGHPNRPDSSYGQIRPDVYQRARAGYYGHMTHIDHQLNRFIEALDDNQAGPTYLCFVSDHGELMGDHNLWRKSLPYEGSARVPLILKGPKDSGIRKNSIISEPVELRDVMPTLLECAGLPAPESVEGKSILPLARGESRPWREYLHGEHTALGSSVHYITDGRRKYVWISGTGAEQLFDLKSDPQELHNLAGKAAAEAVLRQFRGHLVTELTGREEGFVDGGKLVAGRPVRACLSHILGDAK